MGDGFGGFSDGFSDGVSEGFSDGICRKCLKMVEFFKQV